MIEFLTVVQISNVPTKPTLASQFTIKRLLWTLIIASVFLKIADMTGIFRYAFSNWESASNVERVIVIFSSIMVALIGIGYTAWIGLRLPWLIESYFEIRNRRKRRREEYAKIVSAKTVMDSKDTDR